MTGDDNYLYFQSPARQHDNASPPATPDDKNILISFISAKSVTPILFIQTQKSSNKYSYSLTPLYYNDEQL